MDHFYENILAGAAVLPHGPQRMSYWARNFAPAFDGATRTGAAQNGNSYSGTLLTNYLIDGFIAKLQNRWAPLRAFSTQFSGDTYKPLAMHVLKYTNATTSAQINATNFEAGNGDTIDPVSVTMSQYTKNFSISNAELNSGLRMENLIGINVAGFCDSVTAAAMAPITDANFGTVPGVTGAAAPVVSSSLVFDFLDLRNMWGGLKKSPVKNLILDGEYMAAILNQPGYFQPGVSSDTDPGALKRYGWDGLFLSTTWSGAGSNIRGFACNPQAITLVAGLPVEPPASPNLIRKNFEIPALGITVALHVWMSLATRTAWASYDVMLGAAATDKTAGILIKSQ